MVARAATRSAFAVRERKRLSVKKSVNGRSMSKLLREIEEEIQSDERAVVLSGNEREALRAAIRRMLSSLDNGNLTSGSQASYRRDLLAVLPKLSELPT